jgi:hypothetical protein
MNTLQYATGRTYDAPQVLTINVESLVADDFGFQDVTATFTDASRHITGRVSVVVCDGDIGPAVLAAYDAGQYDAIYRVVEVA